MNSINNGQNQTQTQNQNQKDVKNKTRRVVPSYAQNSGLEEFLDLNASEAYKRPWHRLERGLRLNRLRLFIEIETKRMNLSDLDKDQLTNLLHKALDKKQLNSKTCVIYDSESEEIKEIKGLIYHKTADGRIMSQIVEKKTGVTFRAKKATGKVEPAQTPTAQSQVEQQ